MKTALKITTIDHEARKILGLSMNEFAVIELISKLEIQNSDEYAGWCLAYKTEIAEMLDLTKQTVFSILNKLLKKGLIERHPRTKHIRTTPLWFETTFFTPSKDSLPRVKKINTPSFPSSPTPSSPLLSPENTSPSEREDTPKRRSSCPLDRDKKNPASSLLQVRYQNGHTECVEYLTSEEKDRDQKFINRSKQFMFIHKILRAGYGFDSMDKTIRQMDKRYGKGHWDYSNMANWLEKGSSNA